MFFFSWIYEIATEFGCPTAHCYWLTRIFWLSVIVMHTWNWQDRLYLTLKYCSARVSHTYLSPPPLVLNAISDRALAKLLIYLSFKMKCHPNNRGTVIVLYSQPPPPPYLMALTVICQKVLYVITKNVCLGAFDEPGIYESFKSYWMGVGVEIGRRIAIGHPIYICLEPFFSFWIS